MTWRSIWHPYPGVPLAWNKWAPRLVSSINWLFFRRFKWNLHLTQVGWNKTSHLNWRIWQFITELYLKIFSRYLRFRCLKNVEPEPKMFNAMEFVMLLYCWWFRNPANQSTGSSSHNLEGFIHPTWCRISTITCELVDFVPTFTPHNPHPVLPQATQDDCSTCTSKEHEEFGIRKSCQQLSSWR